MPFTLKKQLQALASSRKPVVLLGKKGLTEAVLAEIQQALLAHELIKIQLSGDRDARQQDAQHIQEVFPDSIFIQMRGRQLTIYQAHPDHPRTWA